MAGFEPDSSLFAQKTTVIFPVLAQIVGQIYAIQATQKFDFLLLLPPHLPKDLHFLMYKITLENVFHALPGCPGLSSCAKIALKNSQTLL